MTGKGRELADMMERRKVAILCVQETRWKGSKAISIGAGFKLFYYAVDSKRNGVGVVLKEEFMRNVLEVKRVSDRVMSLKLEIEGVMLNVVSGYAPQVGCELEEKERFWSELDEVMESIPTGERVVIGTDFNGHVDEGNRGDEEVMAKFGVKERNLEGQMVVDFAKRMDMAVVNTYFQKREEHRVTYKSGGRRTQVDYILCRRGNLKEISDCIVVVGESVARQHRMVVCRMTLMVCKTKRSKIEKKTKWWIFKNKGDVQSCSNYRGIKLMSHTMKLWERVVEARFRKVVEICEQQYGFMPRKSTTDAIFSLRILMEKYRDGQRELHCVFVDLEKVYDRVPREELWYCMRKSGVAEKYVRVVQDVYERSRTVVRCAVGQTEEFKVEVGLHQGSALSPFLFAIVMDQLSEEVRQESPWTMMFADDIVICSESREQVEENLERWRSELERRGMKVSRSKTEYMCVNEREGSGTVRLQGEEVKKVQEFKYLGSTVQSNGECGKEVKKRVQADWNGWRKVSGVLYDMRIKKKVYRTVVRPAMLYGLETVSLRKRQESELEVAELKMLRFSLGVTRLDRIRNEYIRGTAHVGRLGDKVREARLRWFGHVQRREIYNINTIAIRVYNITTYTTIVYNITTYTTIFYNINTSVITVYNITTYTTTVYNTTTNSTTVYNINTSTITVYNITAYTTIVYNIITNTTIFYNINTSAITVYNITTYTTIVYNITTYTTIFYNINTSAITVYNITTYTTTVYNITTYTTTVYNITTYTTIVYKITTNTTTVYNIKPFTTIVYNLTTNTITVCNITTYTTTVYNITTYTTTVYNITIYTTIVYNINTSTITVYNITAYTTTVYNIHHNRLQRAAPDAPNPSPSQKVRSSDGSWGGARNVERPVGGARSRARHLGGEREAKARRVGGSEDQGEASGGNEDQGKARGGSEKQERNKWGEQRTRRQGQRVRRDVHNRAEAPNDVHSRAAEPSDVHSRAAGPSDVHRRAAAPSDVHRRALAPSDVHRRTTAPGRRCPSRWGLELPKGREGGSKVLPEHSSAGNRMRERDLQSVCAWLLLLTLALLSLWGRLALASSHRNHIAY
ncbi:hypothetical protein QTP70_010244 [Hemibagrus guttatus]|uniref:ribonuclease H n=1 Tax=Hemibagrus guttatus TaxID=175788 RepID=A0AAE0R2A5_9TELE|nr:hypothetical protein QTP70_010244 [Hemibagrus guttatus]